MAGWDHAWEANGGASVIGGSTVKLLHVAAQMMDPVSLLLQLLLSSCVLGLELEMGGSARKSSVVVSNERVQHRQGGRRGISQTRRKREQWKHEKQ